MPITRIQGQNIANSSISTNKVDSVFTATYATYASVAANLTPRITTVNVANSTYAVLDDTSVNTSGGYLVITGANFQSGALVTIGDTAATSTTYVNDTTLRAQVPAKTAGSYSVYVQNPDGGTAIRVLGVAFSNTPVWGTAAALSNQAANTAFAVSISANSDSNVTYSNTTSLPAGTTLLANGLFYGTVTVGSETVFTFDVNAVDAELQDTPRTFSLTVTVGPPSGSLFFIGGWGNQGISGLNDNNIKRSSPTQVGSNSTWTEVAASALVFFGLKSDNTLWSWGYNLWGDCGLGDTINRSSPVQIGSSTNWSDIVSQYSGVHAIKTNGTLWSWGDNTGAILGLNESGSGVYRSSPTQVGANTTWSKISKSGTNNSMMTMLAIKTDGTLWAWGSTTDGGLGLNVGSLYKSSPTQVGSDTNWSEAVVVSTPEGTGASFAIKTDGTLWSWGNNRDGYLGLNEGEYVFKSSPTQVGSNTNWSKLQRSGQRGYSNGGGCFAIKTDGTLWAWGKNNSGSLGLNDTAKRSSPTQVGAGGTWLNVARNYYGTAAIKQ
ncbi:MAG: IPT/TIG domain-containing protein [Dolichospermum sp.]